jgi:RNA polymerase sigma factor (sigma-70 family)
VRKLRPTVDFRDRDDRAVIDAICARDEEGLRELYRRYGTVCYSLALRITRDRSLAEDVVQEVFVAAWDRASTFEETRGSVRSWLVTQAHHRAVDVVRKETSTKRRNLVLTVADPDRELPGADAVVEEEWLSQRRGQVRAAVAQLPENQQQVLQLAYFSGMTQREIADQIGVPLGTVKSRTITGLRQLKAHLGDTTGEDS